MIINAEILNRFKKISANERLAHAYLFAGSEESGKSETALAVAKLLNCENSTENFFCDQCSACQKINSGNHPDVVLLTTEVGETIKIDDIRAFIGRLQLRAFEAKYKVFVIKNAERLTTEASNALLKTLEEPSRGTMIILTTAVPAVCLDTIKSRCQLVHFFPKPYALLAQQLETELGLNENEAQCLAFFAEGSLAKAQELNKSKFTLKKNKIIDEIVMKRNSDEFLKKTLSDKEATQTTLRVLLSFFRDLALLKSGQDEKGLIHGDRVRDLRSLAQEFSFEDINRIFNQVVKAVQLFKDNLNVKMSLSVIKELVWVK